MRTRTLLAIAIAGAAITFTAPATAQTAPPVYDTCVGSANGNLQQTYPRSCVSVAASGTPVGNYGQISGAAAAIVNGREDAGGTYVQGPSPTAASTNWTAGGWDNSASAQSNSNSIASGSANLTEGALHGRIINPDATWGSGSYLSQISDIVTFNNNSGSAITLAIGYSFDGRFTGIVPGNGYETGFVGMAMTSPDSTLKFAGTGSNLTGGTNGYASGSTIQFDAAGGGYGPAGYVGLSTFMNAADYTATMSFDQASGLVQGSFSSNIIIPTGESQFGFAMFLGLDCRQKQSSCDFGNTSQLDFGALPTGLSFTSESGVLFSANASDPGAVPEPATWAMMIAGFGMIGASLRRRPARGQLKAA